MADKFLGVGGTDGTKARPLKMDVEGNLEVRDIDVKAELELIKDQQAEILAKLSEPIDTQLTGSNVEDDIPVKTNVEEVYNGEMVLKTRQMGLAYKSWNINQQDRVTVAGGSRLEEQTATHTNGFSTLAFISRCVDYVKHDYKIGLRWQTVDGRINSQRSFQEDFSGSNGTQFASGVTPTKAEYVVVSLSNEDEESHDYHVGLLLRV